eukprot:gene9193-9359_t
MADTDPYKVLMLKAWAELITSTDTTSDTSFWALAGVHGMDWSYNGTVPPATVGFCRHAQADFGPWHRPYVAAFELGLQAAATRAAARFATQQLRDQYLAVAQQIRLPYFDWTQSSVPRLLTASTVTVLDNSGRLTTIGNPLGLYRYVKYPGGGRSSIISRAYDWAGAIARSASSSSNMVANFVRSYSWGCTYTSSQRCAGNLEGVHNNIHNYVGGSTGEMATVRYAGFDPIFWLHHAQIDRLLWLFQNNGGQWQNARTYAPFITTDASNLRSFGYNYRDPYRSWQSQSAVTMGHRKSLLDDSPQALPSELPILDSGSEIGSPAAVAAVDRALASWTDGYRGYSWQLQLLEWDRNQLGRAVHVFIFLNATGTSVASTDSKVTSQPWIPSSRYNFNHLRVRNDYCGSVSGFNVLIKHLTGQRTTAAVALDSCLRAAGIDPNAVPADPAAPGAGPAAAIVKPSDLRLLALTQHGRDVTSRVNFGKLGISWSLPAMETGKVRATGAADAADSHSEGNASGAAAADTPSAASTAGPTTDIPVHSLMTGLFV